MKKFVNIIKQSNLISILFSILLSFSIAFTFYNYISEGTILSKRYALFSAAIFAFSLIGLLIFRVAPFLKRVLSSERIILIIILVVFISIDVNGILSVPKAFFLLENQEVEFSVNSDPSIEERDECLFEMLSVYDGNQWSYGEAINHKLTESNVENNQANNLCPKREIFWQGKPYQEMTIIFQKQPDGGYVKVRYGEQAYAIDLESYDFQEYQLNIPINHNKFNLFLVEKLPRIITLFFTISVLFILLGLIDKNVNRFFVNYLSNINNSDQLIIIFLSFSFIALVFDFLFLEQIINRLGLFLILFLIHIGIGYLLFHKPGIIKKVRSFKYKRIFLLSFFLILITLVLFRANPYFHKLLDNDEGIFLYIGRELLNGKILYKDLWDHKTPMIYLINMVGEFIGNGTRWGIFSIEVISLIIASYLCFKFIKDFFGTDVAFFGTTLFLLSLPSFLVNGNDVEEFALPLQFLLIWLYKKITVDNSQSSFHALLIGLCSGILFLLRQNMIGTLIAIAFALCIICFETKNLEQLLILGFYIFIGFIAIQLISILYFYYHGALRDFWRIAFLFNFQYSSRTHSGTINSIVKGWRIIGNPFLFSIFMIGFVLLTTKIFMYSPKRNSFEKKPNLHSIKVLAMFMIPIEFLLTGISGRNFPHYYQTWLPSITLVSSYLIHQIKTINCEKRNASIWKNFALLPFIICITLLPPFVNLTRSVLRYQPQSTPKIVDYIKENTSEDDWVLTWGTHSLLRVLYQSHRVTPTRFTSQTSFVYPDYRTSEDIVHFCHEVALQTPELIIDDNDFSIEKEIADDPYFSCFTNFVRENYTHMGKFEDNILNPLYGMDIYKLNEKDIQ